MKRFLLIVALLLVVIDIAVADPRVIPSKDVPIEKMNKLCKYVSIFDMAIYRAKKDEIVNNPCAMEVFVRTARNLDIALIEYEKTDVYSIKALETYVKLKRQLGVISTIDYNGTKEDCSKYNTIDLYDGVELLKLKCKEK